MRNKLIKVNGHPRSGNNFLCALMKKNFYPDQDVSKELDRRRAGHASKNDQPMNYYIYGTKVEPLVFDSPWGAIAGSHHPQHCTQNSIYIIRNTQAVARSLHHHTHFLSPAQEQLSYQEYVEQPLDWTYIPDDKKRTIYNHHKEHIYRALQHSPLVLSYELLLQQPTTLLATIALYFSLSPVPHYITTIPYCGWSSY